MMELHELASELDSVEIRPNVPDTRLCRLTNKKLSNKSFYTNSFRHLQVDDQRDSVWRSAAPLKCKIFGWLARRQRLPTNERRFRHNMTTSSTCPYCPAPEDTDHLLLRCPRALELWGHFHLRHAATQATDFSDFLVHSGNSLEAATINAAIAWNIWKRRNALVFNGINEDIASSARRCVEDVRLWAFRCTAETSKTILNNWCNGFEPP
jgi:hypothetical protein